MRLRKNSFIVAGAMGAALCVLSIADSQNHREVGWPRSVMGKGYRMRVYPPLRCAWTSSDVVTCDFPIIAKAEREGARAIAGVGTLKADTLVDKSKDLVQFVNPDVIRASFPGQTNETTATLIGIVKTALREPTVPVKLSSLTALIKSQPKTTRKAPKGPEPLPKIDVSQAPAMLVAIDGEPVWKRVPGTTYERILNTNAIVLRPNDASYVLLGLGDRWLRANTLNGPWSWSQKPSYTEVQRKSLHMGSNEIRFTPGPTDKALAGMDTRTVPRIFVHDTPAALIYASGPFVWQRIAGTELSFIQNTRNAVFKHASGNFFALISGRWFSTRDMNAGQWSRIKSESLPSDFKKIPPRHPRRFVLAFVKGSPESHSLSMWNSIVQSATVRPSQIKFSPEYDGEPKFESIAGTSMKYAANSKPTVFKKKNALYAVYRGVWFQSSDAGGPWRVATSVDQEIYSIPMSSPFHYATHVRVYGVKKDAVTVGYTAGYLGTVESAEGIVFGSGGDRTTGVVPWIGKMWIARAATYGFGIEWFAWALRNNIYETWNREVLVATLLPERSAESANPQTNRDKLPESAVVIDIDDSAKSFDQSLEARINTDRSLSDITDLLSMGPPDGMTSGPEAGFDIGSL